MQGFGLLLKKSFPQIDRVCWTTVENDQLTVRRVAQIESFRESCESAGVSTSAADCALANISHSQVPKAFGDLTQHKEKDLEFMSAAAKSSFHVPLELKNQTGTMNFWSADSEAFPKPVQEALLDLIHRSLASQ